MALGFVAECKSYLLRHPLQLMPPPGSPGGGPMLPPGGNATAGGPGGSPGGPGGPSGGADGSGPPAVGGLPPGLSMEAWNCLGGYMFVQASGAAAGCAPA